MYCKEATLKENNSNHKTSLYISVIVTVALLIAYTIPVILFQGNSIMNPHDNFDSVNSWIEMLKQNGLLFSLDTPTPCFDGMPTTYFGYVNYSFYTLIFYLFNNLAANIITYLLGIVFSFIFMLMLLNYVVKDNLPINLLVSAMFAVLPVIPSYYFAISTIPLFFYLLLRGYCEMPTFKRKTFFLFLFPFFSLIVAPGVFLLGIWFLAIFIYRLRRKAWNSNLVVGFILLCGGYIIVDFKMFYQTFWLHEPLNRDIFTSSNPTFFSSFKTYFVEGWYHTPFLQRKLLFPLLCISFIFITTLLICKKRSLSNQALNNCYIFIGVFGMIFTFSIIAALYDVGFINRIVGIITNKFNGFNFGRVWMLNKVLWYLCFAVLLKLLCFRKSTAAISLLLAIIQIFIIGMDNSYLSQYAVANKTVINEVLLKPKGIKRNNFISYNDFYSQELFLKIKNDISYTGETVVCIGFHPAVLMFSGFSTLDGYLNCYPLQFMQDFREILEPEFEVNIKDRDYFDSWGGRLYLYNDQLSYVPTYEKATDSIELRVNATLLREKYQVRYLFSRAQIANTEALGLNLLKYYQDEFYDIHLYELKSC